MKKTIEELTLYLRGWIGYFGFSETPGTRESDPLDPETTP